MASSYLMLFVALISMATFSCSQEDGDSKKTDSSFIQGAPIKVRNDLSGVPFQTPERASLGGDSSGGGPGVVCYQGDNVVSVNNLDIYEAKALWRKEIPNSDASVSDQLRDAINRLRPLYVYLALDIEMTLQWIAKHHEMVEDGQYFTQQPHDLGHSWVIPVKENCRIQYVGFYDKTGLLKISRAAYQKMNNTERAAFLLHEALYALYRERTGLEKPESEKTRLLVGTLLEKNFSSAEAQGRLLDFTRNEQYYDNDSGLQKIRPLPAENFYFIDRKEDGYFKLSTKVIMDTAHPVLNPLLTSWLTCWTADGQEHRIEQLQSNSLEHEIEMRDVGCMGISHWRYVQSWSSYEKGGGHTVDPSPGSRYEIESSLSYDGIEIPPSVIYIYDLKASDYVPEFP